MHRPEFLNGTSRLLPSAHGLEIYYRLFYGTLKWPSEQRIALVVLLQKGETEDFREAMANGEVLLDRPAEILDEDLDDVLEAMAALRRSQ